MTRRSQKTWTKWQKLVSEQERSGQTAGVFCGERGISRSYFSVWKRRLREEPPVKFLEVQLSETTASAAGDSRLEIRLQNGRSLLVGRGFDAEHVRALLALVEAAK